MIYDLYCDTHYKVWSDIFQNMTMDQPFARFYLHDIVYDVLAVQLSNCSYDSGIHLWLELFFVSTSIWTN